MSIAHFDAAGGMTERDSSTDEGIIKNALIVVEGTHKDNKGRVHEFPAHRIQDFVDNTNAAIAEGLELPLMVDHSKELIKNGHLQKLGWLAPNTFIECRVIRNSDVPNSRMRDKLVGKIGAFGKFLITNRVDDVKKKLISLLSPGIDLESDRIAEVSAVAFPAIQGPALFAAATSYAEAKEQFDATKKLRQEVNISLDILFSVLNNIEKMDDYEVVGNNRDALKLKAVDDFYEDVLSILELETTQEDLESTPIISNPYQRELIPAANQFSQFEDEEDMAIPRVTALKTRRRK